jgi:hypothetical protein
MARYTVGINIDSSSFPEIGTPLFPNSVKEVKPSKANKEDYAGYTSSVNMCSGEVSSDLNRYEECGFVGGTGLKLDLAFEKETSKTYKFLGMDVDENFDAIIKMNSGHVIVAHLFDREAVTKGCTRSLARIDVEADAVVKSIPESAVRKLATGLKEGLAYSLCKDASSNYNGLIDPENLRSILNPISETLDAQSSGDILEFESVLLNLVHTKKNEQANMRSSGNTSDVASFIVQAIFNYWNTVIKKYNTLYSTLASMDLWSDMNKRILGEDTFNSRFGNCITLKDNDTKQAVEGQMISFSGISKDGAVSDANVIRSGSKSVMESLSECLRTGYNQSIDAEDFLAGFVDSEAIDDVYSLTMPELQALSVLDSLKYIDEDAVLCRESYDMNDPDQRGLFVKSSIRSYERNFKEFKPATQYDVTDALADMVERGDIVNNPTPIPKENASPTGDDDSPVVTSTQEDIDVTVNKSKLLKILKLVNKSTDRILKGF